MDNDPAVIIGLVFVAAFIAVIVWAEIYTRRQRRRSPPGEVLAPPTGPSKRKQ